MDRKKLLKWCGMFFAVMVIFTAVSRAASSISVAQVETGKIQNKTIAHVVQGSGTIEGTKERAVFVLEDQLVKQVLVREGQAVKKGETLLVFSTDQLKETIREKEDRIEELTLQIGDLESQAQVAETAKKRALRRAQEDYNLAEGNGSVTISNARRELEAARQKLDDYYASLSGEFTDEPADKSQEQALLDEIRMRQEAVDQAVMSSNQDRLAARRGMEDAAAESARDSTVENVRRELAREQEELENLNKILKRKGRVKAPVNGVIKRISAVTGGLTGQDAAMVLYETTGTFRVETSITEEDVKYARVGEKAVLKGADGVEKTGVIEAVGEDRENPELQKISIAVSEGEFRIGENVEIEISREEGPYSACVPLGALGEENGKNFVYVADTQDTILGEVLVARRVQVNVKNKNASFAALEEGVLTADQRIITYSDREITEGSRVRLMEP